MRLLSMDLETTGLDARQHGIIQIGAIAFELGVPGSEEFFIELDPEGMIWSVYCLELHRDWIKSVNERIKQKKFEGHKYTSAKMAFKAWACKQGFYQQEPGRKQPSKPTVAGKCFGTFDANFLNFRWHEEEFRKRVMDPCHYYIDFTKDGDILPDLPTCKARAIATGCLAIKSAVVTHNALDDSRDVMHLLQHAYSKGWMHGYQNADKSTSS